jgi:hypothetical protein
MSRFALCLLIVLMGSGLLSAQRQSDQAACVIRQKEVNLPCPEGWNQLRADARETVIGNFAVTAENRDRMSGPGMATLTVMAKRYKDVAQWVWVAKKGNPDLAETRLKVTNESSGEISVVSLESKEESGPVFTSYIFELQKMPILVELVCRANDPKKAEYRKTARWMSERATVVRQ